MKCILYCIKNGKAFGIDKKGNKIDQSSFFCEFTRYWNCEWTHHCRVTGVKKLNWCNDGISNAHWIGKLMIGKSFLEKRSCVHACMHTKLIDFPVNKKKIWWWLCLVFVFQIKNESSRKSHSLSALNAPEQQKLAKFIYETHSRKQKIMNTNVEPSLRNWMLCSRC